MPRKRNLHGAPILMCAVLLAGCAPADPPVEVSVSPAAGFVAPGQTIQFTATVTNGTSDNFTWAVNGIVGGNSSVGTIDSTGKFTAPAVAQNRDATIGAVSKRNFTTLGSALVWIVAPGSVASTNEPQVALYTIAPPSDATVSIQFGTDTSYGLTTWTRATPAGGGPVSIYVAGMRANTEYHMRAVVQFAAGGTVDDADHTFTTGAFPSVNLPKVAAATTAGMMPQPGVELLALLGSTQFAAVVTDLAGNVLWAYQPPVPSPLIVNPIKLLPDGNFLINSDSTGPDGANSLLQEVDLGGNVVWQMSAADLNQALANATCAGCNISIVGTHHDFALLPNGHLIVIAALQKVIGGVTVTGDALIDLDRNRRPVRVWSAFDHLDVNRSPLQWPDWTHTNTVIYSPDDGNLIISMRNQSWVMKIDYRDGAGTGNILWKLGYQGDFSLQGGTDPIDWQYAQHDPNIISVNSAGVVQLALFDDGDSRVLDASGNVCGTTGQIPCYTRIPIFQLDEAAKTATIQWVDDLSPLYVFFGGSTRVMANGDIEFDECATTVPANNAAIVEVTPGPPPQTVWQLNVNGQYVYRGFRMPSLYPGVQW